MDASGGWQRYAACLDSPVDFTANLEAQEPDPEAVAICERCPVRVECLDYALQLDLWGTFGATSHWQRRQLKRRYRRAICPVCRVENGVLLELGSGQACLTCAVSWRATPARLRAGG
jgi:WhiB family redox-sensing transcriptional regulator